MRAWQHTGTRQPLILVDLPEPLAAPGDVVLSMRAAGMCHSDVGFWDGTQAGLLDHTPIVLGHENAGVIASIGADVDGFSVGDRVAAYPIARPPFPGTQRDGGYADRVAVPADGLVKIPDGVSFEQAAVASDAGMTAYHAVHASGDVQAGSRVGIVGLGGLGMQGARLAVLAGAEVHAAEINPALTSEAHARGVVRVVTDVAELAASELDVIIDFVGLQSTLVGAIRAVRTGGRVVLVGLGATEVSIPTALIAEQQVHLVGSWGGTQDDMGHVLELLATGDLVVEATVIGFDEIGAGLERLASGQSGGHKLVARFGD